MKDRDRDILIQLLLDGEIAPAEFEELEELMIEDAEARQRFYDYARLHQGLSFHLAKSEAGDRVGPSIREARRRQRFRRVMVAAAAALILLGVAVVLVPRSSPAPLATMRLSEGAVHSVFHALEHEGSEPPAGALEAGSSVVLEHGNVEVVFASGVKSVVQAPARITVESDDRLVLEYGVGWFRVPKRGRGFQVATTELEIIDLGTEFGVIASEEAPDEVHCLKGAVSLRSPRYGAAEQTLRMGEARTIDSVGQLQPVPVGSEKFPTDLQSEPAYLHFSFDKTVAGRFDADGNCPVRVMAGLVTDDLLSCHVPGVSGNAVALHGNGEWIATNWPGFAGAAPRTVAFWLRIPPEVKQHESEPPVFMWGDAMGGRNSLWKASVTRKDAAGGVVARISFGVERFDGTTRLNDGKWHHVVTTYTGKTLANGLPEMRVHVDGRVEALTRNVDAKWKDQAPKPVNTMTKSAGALPLCLGALRTDPGLATFRGEIDEFYIFRSAISEERIRELVAEKR